MLRFDFTALDGKAQRSCTHWVLFWPRRRRGKRNSVCTPPFQ
jgi:hypothetical protein